MLGLFSLAALFAMDLERWFCNISFLGVIGSCDGELLPATHDSRILEHSVVPLFQLVDFERFEHRCNHHSLQ